MENASPFVRKEKVVSSLFQEDWLLTTDKAAATSILSEVDKNLYTEPNMRSLPRP